MHSVLTKSNMFLIKYVALILGLLMNGIFFVLSNVGIANVGLAIIFFTIIVYGAMTPLQIKQQRFSKMNAVMQPELNAIRKKYAGKKDQISQQKMMDEQQAVFAKYGVSPTGSCVQLIIQLPVLFALYQVIYKIPGYITLIGDKLAELAMAPGFEKFFNNLITNDKGEYYNVFKNLSQVLTNTPDSAHYVDAIYKMSSNQWETITAIAEKGNEPFLGTLTSVREYVSHVTNFFSLNISDSPLQIIQAHASVIMVVVAVLIPLLAYATQVLNYKMMPQPNGGDDAMANSMNTMNKVMPIMSAVFCLTLPTGIGIYWIIGAVVRTVQMFIINRKMDKENLDEVIAKNKAKAEEKMKKFKEKTGVSTEQVSKNVNINTRHLEVDEDPAMSKRASLEARMKALEERDAVKPAEGSIAARANMVADYESKHQNTRKHADAKKK
ncbi:MAG: YidC/Oxa1 family membrane protein insertase [Lachnospiraceae bacterium]|nr:YidC/Oxa1 family membrane protein insertase [Lachnospiraceae bacterium]